MLHLRKKFGYYSILNRQEVLSWFLDKRRENKNVCGRCQESDCYTCNRFNYVRTQLEINAYFEAQDWPHQPICDKYLKTLIKNQIVMTKTFIDFMYTLKEQSEVIFFGKKI